jgi:hypothetical protein
MQILCKHKSFLTNKLKEELFVLSNALKTRQLVISQKFPFSFQSTQPLQKQTFSKRDFFFIFYKTLKTMKMTNFEIYKL